MQATAIAPSRLSPIALAVAAALAACGALDRAEAAQLPVPCVAACGPNSSTWVQAGNATLTQGGNTLTVNQGTHSVILNWQSFNISADGKVNFVQPSSSAVAVNQIFQGSASQIFGALNSNGTVYLLNQNGVVFGTGSAVNVGGLLASSLSLTPAAQTNGIAGTTAADGSVSPSLQPWTTLGETVNRGSVQVQQGASLTANQGQILLFAPTVTNSGTLSTPSGQTILGAGQYIYLTASNEPTLRGLLIQVGGCSGQAGDPCGTVVNTGAAGGGLGQILANTGNVTLAGLAVQQNGRISATTSVRTNGSIRLQAGQDSNAGDSASFDQLPTQSGTLTLGQSSLTSVSLEGSPGEKTVDVNAQPKSQVQLIGGQIDLLSNASISAPGGTVTLTALTNPQTQLTLPTTQPDTSRIYLAPSSSIDVSGATVSLPVEDNSLAVQLRGSQTADFPQQRAGALRGQTVYVDLRQHGRRPDGSLWVGTPLADLSGDVSAIQRDVFERNLTGGTINFKSGGSVIVSPGATLNVSGGQIDWQAGHVKSSVLVAPNGQLTPIGRANPYIGYLGTLDSISQGDPHWGAVANVTLPGYDPRGVYQPAYVEGKDAGSISIVAPSLVLDGTVKGGAVRGPLQRNPTTDLGLLVNGSLVNQYYPGFVYRFPDEVPLGGSLTLGTPGSVGVLNSLTFASGAVLPTLTAPGGGAFDPLQDPLQAGFVSSLRPDLFAPDNLTRLSAYAERSITVPAEVTLAPGPGANFALTAGSVDFAGSIVSNGGSVLLETLPTVQLGGTVGGAPAGSPPTSLVVEPTASIDLRGAWVNDSLAFNQTPFAPLYINGGSATILSADGGLLSVASGAKIDVSGGAQRTPARSVVAGRGGAIAIDALPTTANDNPEQVRLPANLSAALAGYGLFDGGKLTLILPNLCVSSAACADPTAYRVDPAALTDLGFESVTLAASTFTPGGLTVASDVNELVRQRNLDLLPGAFNAPSAATLQGLTQVVTLPAYLRHPENLTLTSNVTLLSGAAAQFADLTVSAGATLGFDPGSTVNLSTNSRIFLDGTISAPAGSVEVAISGSLLPDAGGLVPNQGIWLGSASMIDVRGTTVTTPNTAGRLLGSVLAGGSVSVHADRGFLDALPGSQILAGGTSGTLDLPSPGTGVFTRQTVASAGGSISLRAAEGIQYDGLLSAAAGGEGVPGGSLTLGLDGNPARAGNSANGFGFPGTTLTAPRVLTVSAGEVPVVIGEGGALPEFLDGLGRISAAQINAGGFADVKLRANDLVVLQDPNNPAQILPAVHGAVAFEGGVSLHPAASLTVDSGEIRAASPGAVQLASSYVSLGSSDTRVNAQTLDTSALAGTASLAVQANLIDLVGATTLNGFGTAALASAGDIRLRGVQLQGSVLDPFNGTFVSPGPLRLSAQQIYPTTLSNFTVQVNGSDPTQSMLTLARAPGTPSTVLSAAGNLTLSAASIVDAGVVKAPIGTVTLQGQSVSLESGSLLSVSAAGTTIPFGQTQGGFDWTYLLTPDALHPEASGVIVYGTGPGKTPVPGKQITVQAANFQFKPGATLDTSGGGDLTAYEWIPGLGGTRDVLSATQSPGLYAVLPGANLSYAPIDPTEDRGFLPAVGSSVYLSGGAGLPAGTYALLPPRYALLPGAYLVKAVPGYTDLAAGQSMAQFDGSTIVSGYRVNAQTGLRDSRTSGFDVVSGAYAVDSTQSRYTLAQYNLTSANTFFADQARTSGVAAPRLPADAGAVALGISQTAQLQGTLLATTMAGHRGGTVDITAADLFVTGQPASAPAGAVALDVNQLDQLGAESLLLGATRSSSGIYTQLNLPATSGTPGGNIVEIASGAVLKAPEVILAASQGIQLDPGAAIIATGVASAGEPDLLAPAGTAIVRASTGAQIALNPPAALSAGATQAAPLTASINVAAGASVTAPGSVSVDAGGAVTFSGALSASGAAVRLGGEQLALGAAGPGFGGFVIGPNLLSGLSGADLTLQVSNPSAADYGTRAISVFGPVQLGLNSLAIDAPGLLAATADGNLTVTARSVTLGSDGAQAYNPGSAGSAALAINADHVSLSGGTFAAGGFANTTLTASRDFTLAGNGAFGTSGTLNISSPIMQSTAGKTYQVIAAGSLTAGGPAGAASAPTSIAGPGGAINFQGANVTLDGHIVMPAGRITASTTGGGIRVGSGAVLDVSGFGVNFDGEVRSAAGGTIQLAAALGDVDLAAGSVLDVSAGTGGGAGGTLALLAPNGAANLGGTVRGGAAAGATGGRLSVEAQQLDFAALVAQAGSAGFTGGVNLHERGVGNFVLSSGTLRARDVELTADQGAITIGSGAVIDARSPAGGRVVLAGQSVEIGGALLADSTSRADHGGSVELLSGGPLRLDAGASISVAGAGNSATAASAGSVWLRAPQSVVQTAGSAGSQLLLNGSVSGAGSVTLEAYHTPYVISGATSLNPTDPTTMAQWNADAGAFMSSQAPAVLSALKGAGSIANQPGFSILPGIEVQAPGDLRVSAPWDLSQYRFNDASGAATVPGVLTVRTGGSLYVDNSISDGFSGLGFVLGPTPRSWSYRLASGANLASADPLAVVPLAAAGPADLAALGSDAGSVILAPGQPPTAGTGGRGGSAGSPGSPVMIRTGTGSIDIAAAGDLRLGNQASVIYTAGTAGPGATAAGLMDGAVFANLQLPQSGGSVAVTVGRNIVGATTPQLFNDWLFRGGQTATARGGYLPASWAPAYSDFNQGIGALGGGDLTVRAGGNISDLGAVVPSTGVPSGTGAGATTTEQNDGLLTVESGGDILGGKFLDMAGNAVITAGGGIRTGTPQARLNADPAGLNLLLGVGSGTFDVTARSDLMVEAAFEATLLPRAVAQVGGGGRSTIFSTFMDASSLTLQSTGGTLAFTNRPELIGDTIAAAGISANPNGTYLGTGAQVLPPTFAAIALGGNIAMGNSGDPLNHSLGLWPGAHGNLDLLAVGSVRLSNAGIMVSDADPASLPTVNAFANLTAGAGGNPIQALDPRFSDVNPAQAGLHAPQPLHGGAYAADGQPDRVPVRVVALNGDVVQITPAGVSDYYFLDVPKPIDVVAGGNIQNLRLLVQQLSPGDTSSVRAGGDILYPFGRNPTGALTSDSFDNPAGEINVAGPGQFEMQAGGTVNLGTSRGISSVGNLYNPALPALGANLNVAAGITQTPHYQDFINAYLVNGITYDQQLMQFVGQATGQQNLDKSDALKVFEGLSTAQQAPLLQTILFDELRAGGRSAAAAGPGHNDFTRAFTALTTMYPGAALDRSKGGIVPYNGDLLLYFSRIYTLAGGNIDLLAPGGHVNAGLAVAPTSFGLTKGAADLGIVAQSTGSDNILAYSDIAVNQSRVFAADGGDILMWSTFGNIDAGRGAKTAISAPPPVITVDPQTGKVTEDFPAALLGSGIQTLATTPGVSPGSVDLFAPNGVVNANDAGIVAGNLTIAATAVLGASNISFSGAAVGLPPPALALGALTSSASSSAGAASGSATNNATESGGGNANPAPHAAAAMSWLDVFVLGLGEENCKTDDLDCIKRQKH